MTEGKSGTLGPYSDTYLYVTNGSGGDTATLDRVNRGAGLLRDYTFDAGGFLDSVSASGNTIDFVFDAAGQLAQTSRAGQSMSFLDDGRGYLGLDPIQIAGDPPCPAPPPGEVESFCDGLKTSNTSCWSSTVGGGSGGTCPGIRLQNRVDVTYSSEGRLFGLDRTPAGSTATASRGTVLRRRPVMQLKKPSTGPSERLST